MVDAISNGMGLYDATARAAQGTAKTGASGFADMMGQALGNVRGSVGQAEQGGLASLDDSVNLEDLATAVSDAEVTLKAVVAIRDRIIAAYQDIIKMPI